VLSILASLGKALCMPQKAKKPGPVTGAALRIWGRVSAQRHFIICAFYLLLNHMCTFTLLTQE